ncbi:MAG: beta-hydroxyacyl-ACP dehydratase [Thermoguttaceae bacterium]|nr:beta-hydroxyacyl-ACP dehydratase [Thermoguttaceae bacterium]
MDREEVMAAIPHRDPFLFVDEIVEVTDTQIVCRKTFTGAEAFFQGHYPDFPLVPGVLLCEAALQTGAVFLKKRMETAEKTFEGKMPVVAKMTDIRFRQAVRPGDTVEITDVLEDAYANAFQMAGTVTVNGKMAVKLKFTVMMVEKTNE